MLEKEYELKLSDGKTVKWVGFNGENAAMRYVDCCGKNVIAWREVSHGLFIYNHNHHILEATHAR